MKSSSLESKTVRPGGLMQYSFYASDRHPAKPAPKQKSVKRGPRLLWPAVLVLLIGGGLAYAFKPSPPASPKAATASSKTAQTGQKAPAITPAAAKAAPVNNCASDTLSQEVIVSISQRHLWACQGTQSVYDSPVVTGIDYLAADKTPLGTYHVYGKYTNQVLTGSDSTGSWRDPVSYWMPFLDNQYGQYGFHDATWRAPTDFGNIAPNSANGSHGCVELPLATAKWLYGWVSIGTAVVIES